MDRQPTADHIRGRRRRMALPDAVADHINRVPAAAAARGSRLGEGAPSSARPPGSAEKKGSRRQECRRAARMSAPGEAETGVGIHQAPSQDSSGRRRISPTRARLSRRVLLAAVGSSRGVGRGDRERAQQKALTREKIDGVGAD